MIKVKIDAGHGGKDGGAQGNGLSEKVLTLKISQKIKKGLEEYENVTVSLTRSTDTFLELSERANLANKWDADAFLSVHINSATNTSAKGFETYIYSDTSNPKTQAFQNILHQECMKAIKGDMQDRGKKRANFAVLRQTNMIAVLSENGFIVNASDASKLKSEAFLDKLAQGHVNGFVQFFGLKKKATAKPTTTSGANISKPMTDTKLYKVQVGAFSNRLNAEDLIDKLKKSGYSAFITEE
jgi:N-acetylmuramoyl-L-alanine amidase